MKLAAVYRQLVALKLDADQIAGVLEIMEADAETRKAKGRERVQKWREKQAKSVTVTTGNVTSRLTRGEDSSSKVVDTGKGSKKDTSPSARSMRGTRIPDDFKPDIDAAIAEGISRQEAERQALSFCDFWRSKPGSAALKLDWPATWRVWYRRNLPKPNANAPPGRRMTAVEANIARRMQRDEPASRERDHSDAEFLPPDKPELRALIGNLGATFGGGIGSGDH